MPIEPVRLQSNRIRNQIVYTSIFSILLVLIIGVVVFVLSSRASSEINSLHQSSTLYGSSDTSQIERQVDEIMHVSFLFLTLGSVAMLYLTFNLINAIIPGLRRLSLAVEQIRKGDYDYRLHLPQNSELGSINAALNQSLDQLLQTEAALAKQKAGVEHLVRSRTKQLNIEHAKFVASINGLPLGFILVDSKGRVLMLNPAMQANLKLRPTAAQPLVETVTAKAALLHDLVGHAMKVMSHKKIQAYELTTNDGRFMHCLYSPVIIDEHGAQGVVIVAEDLTEAKILERSKDEFFSIASHELRTPLTAIRGNSSLIQEFYKEQLKDETLNDMVSDIHTSSMRLIEIVNDFLDASRLEQGRITLKLQDLELSEVVNTTLFELAPVAKERGLVVQVDASQLANLPKVHADPEKVEQVLFNLIGNALKFVDNGGVSLAFSVESKHVKIFVNDTGRGISPANQQLLFHKFQQANSSLLTRDTTKGTGLGLYISKLLVNKMGGDIAIESSQEGVGSSFSFTLPLAKHSK